MTDEAGAVRVKVLTGILAGIFLLLAGRLWYLQVTRGGDFAALSEGNRTRVVPVAAPRGVLYDRDGREIVSNRFAYTISIVPMELPADPDPLISHLARVLRLRPSEVRELLRGGAERPYEPVRLKRDAPPEAVIAVEESRVELPGVLVEPEAVRYYPYDALGSHLIGYLGLVDPVDLARDPSYRPTDLIGRTGIERVLETYLRGQNGRREVEVDAMGRPVRVLGTSDATPGLNIRLTIDLEVQKAAEEALDRQLKAVRGGGARDAAGGAVVALDPRNGEILAYVSQPGFDLNKAVGPERGAYFKSLEDDPRHPFLNRPIETYPPGSTFKAITAAALLETGTIRSEEVYNATGYARYGKKDWTQNATPRQPPAGLVTVVEAMARSSDDFFWHYVLDQRFGGVDTIARYAQLFGFGAEVGIDLAYDEKGGLVPNEAWKRRQYAGGPAYDQIWYPPETMDVAIGQGALKVSPLQLAGAYAAIATGGLVYRPQFWSEVLGPGGDVIKRNAPQLLRRMQLSSQTWRVIQASLRAVITDSRGTARGIFGNFPIPVSGKTGTAEVPGRTSHAWFAGYAPAENPEIVIAVFVENGGGGSGVAAPVARRVLEAHFRDELERAKGPGGK